MEIRRIARFPGTRESNPAGRRRDVRGAKCTQLVREQAFEAAWAACKKPFRKV